MESFIKSLPGICGEPLKRYWPDFKRLFTVKSEGFRITYSADLESNARTEARSLISGKSRILITPARNVIYSFPLKGQ